MNKIKLLVLDVDGTLTDGKINMGESGELFKSFSILDGFGIKDMAIPHGIVPTIITGRHSKIVENRAKELGITNIFQGQCNKLKALKEIMEEKSIRTNQIAYIGDDLNDKEPMLFVKEGGGITGAPANAVEKIKKIVNYNCKRKGGDGAVREFIEFILDKKF